ncbi:MAG TPA: substrate-binding domain-containing protein, partial [Elusimicrobiota bacterium]|nr:substrate-binding domain-containing protein [Elusimicrobiota bacterium]
MKNPKEAKSKPVAAGKAAEAVAVRQRLLGVLLRKGTWPMYGFFKEALQGIQRVAFSQGYGLVIVDPAPQGEISLRDAIPALRRTLAGLLMVAPPESDMAVLRPLTDEQFPVVSLYRRFAGMNYVEVDNEGGAEAAVEHLIHLGHTHIAFLSGPADAVDGQERLSGYQKALAKNGLTVHKEYVVAADFEQAKAYKAMKDLLALKKPPTAVFAANDYMALGAISAIHDAGLSVP